MLPSKSLKDKRLTLRGKRLKMRKKELLQALLDVDPSDYDFPRAYCLKLDEGKNRVRAAINIIDVEIEEQGNSRDTW